MYMVTSLLENNIIHLKVSLTVKAFFMEIFRLNPLKNNNDVDYYASLGVVSFQKLH